MAARPRTHNITVQNLYEKLDKRSGQVYYQYRDPRSGKFHGLGSDRKRALSVAVELNDKISQQLLEHYQHILDENPVKRREKGVSTAAWCDKYMQYQKYRYGQGELSIHTLNSRAIDIEVLRARCGHIGVRELDTKTLATIYDEYILADKRSAAQRLKQTWGNLFKEAQHCGEVDVGYNPAQALRSVRIDIRRARLSEEDWNAVLSEADRLPSPFLKHAMKLALTTGLRRSDIRGLMFKDVSDHTLYVTLDKSRGRSKLAFSLDLVNPLLNEPLGDIIAACRQTGTLSQYLVHQTPTLNFRRPGQQVSPTAITNGFAKIRDRLGRIWDGNPPSFHEIRSLAERTYAEIGLNTQLLLGHKTPFTTSRYHDNRGSEYIQISMETLR
ncbi:phage integrase Arm DNA-binding domain-containing protein [Parasalinivibrio latis]|uniref:phage integrase Arm DNA-binding domain-containing protein n=1 Tax=Parasalinivibrio latis TaxID=2952610 RepID=UPI0030E1D06A